MISWLTFPAERTSVFLRVSDRERQRKWWRLGMKRESEQMEKLGQTEKREAEYEPEQNPPS